MKDTILNQKFTLREHRLYSSPPHNKQHTSALQHFTHTRQAREHLRRTRRPGGKRRRARARFSLSLCLRFFSLFSLRAPSTPPSTLTLILQTDAPLPSLLCAAEVYSSTRQAGRHLQRTSLSPLAAYSLSPRLRPRSPHSLLAVLLGPLLLLLSACPSLPAPMCPPRLARSQQSSLLPPPEHSLSSQQV